MSKVASMIRRFHEDREGSNSLEQIVIFALGVLVLGGAWFVWDKLSFGGGAGETGLWGTILNLVKDVFSWEHRTGN